MHGVTTALVSFLLVCVVFPNLVKNRPQYYAALAGVCLLILLDAIGLAVNGTVMEKFRVFAYVAGAFIQVVSLVMLFLACGGISWREMAGDMKEAFEVIRRGGEEKEIVIPLSGEMARMKAQREAERAAAPSERIVINDPPPSAEKPQDRGSLPLSE